VKHIMDNWERERADAMDAILDVALGHAPRART
jgi:hypothetical protein